MSLHAAHMFLTLEDAYFLEKKEQTTRILWTSSIFVGISFIAFIFIGTVIDARSFFILLLDYLSVVGCSVILFLAIRIKPLPPVKSQETETAPTEVPPTDIQDEPSFNYKDYITTEEEPVETAEEAEEAEETTESEKAEEAPQTTTKANENT